MRQAVALMALFVGLSVADAGGITISGPMATGTPVNHSRLVRSAKTHSCWHRLSKWEPDSTNRTGGHPGYLPWDREAP